MNLSLELQDQTKWEKCHLKNVGEIQGLLTDAETQVISLMDQCVVECHSEQCDAGGKCDIHADKETQFYIVFEEKFIRYLIQETYHQIKNELTTLQDFIAVEESDGKLGIHGKADERQLKLWLKAKGYPLTAINRQSKKLDNFILFEILLAQTYDPGHNDLSVIHHRIPSATDMTIHPATTNDNIVVKGICDSDEYIAWRKSLYFTKVYDIPFILGGFREGEYNILTTKTVESPTWSSYEGKTKLTGYYIPS